MLRSRQLKVEAQDLQYIALQAENNDGALLGLGLLSTKEKIARIYTSLIGQRYMYVREHDQYSSMTDDPSPCPGMNITQWSIRIK